jgi:hypothetical protein
MKELAKSINIEICKVTDEYISDCGGFCGFVCPVDKYFLPIGTKCADEREECQCESTIYYGKEKNI